MNEKILNEDRIINDLTAIFIKLDDISAQIAKIPKSNQPQLQTEPVAAKKQYPAVCSICGQTCTVPFAAKPGSRVKCMECYMRQKNGQ
jgi:CxxC-x17-CxxC domain-containing protein